MKKQRITDLPASAFPELIAELGAPAYLAKELKLWIYSKKVSSFEEMSNFPKAVREQLAERFDIDCATVFAVQVSEDGTKKFLCALEDGKEVECVLIPADKGRRTVCISSQVGCAMACDFCRTAKMGLKRHLILGEITSQLRIAAREADTPITNVVFMGMGEPLHNLDAVVEATKLMYDQDAFGLSKRKITVSTSGLIPKMKEFVARSEVKLAISLSATTDEMRDKLMPVNKRYPLKDLMAFCRWYSDEYKHRLTFEYILIEGVNDHKEDAIRLVTLLEGVRAKVNLIPMNPYKEVAYYPTSRERMYWWQNYLDSKGVSTTIRISRGQDILAACGQLARGEIKPALPKIA